MWVVKEEAASYSIYFLRVCIYMREEIEEGERGVVGLNCVTTFDDIPVRGGGLKACVRACVRTRDERYDFIIHLEYITSVSVPASPRHW